MITGANARFFRPFVMKYIRWENEEIRFVRTNAHLGVIWLSANIESVCGNPRTESAIQRIAGIQGYSIKKQCKRTEKAPRKPAVKSKTPDEVAQANVKYMQNNLWLKGVSRK